ncbi:MAG TPA: Zn-dependent alcohol dehydrogenase, partial [Acidimicrobiaceae bacterium]|nr:Zn-dependent alcohol dehydrogenase [Acidimicrobiaceae bacterium]
PEDNLVDMVKEICPNGVDYVFECVGSVALIKASTEMLDWGGSVIMLGVPKMGTEASFVVNTMYNDKSILGCR